MDYKIWNSWYNKSKEKMEDEVAFLKSDVDGGNFFPVQEAPKFLKHLDIVKKQNNMLTLRDLRFYCLEQKPPHFEVDENLAEMFLKTNNKVYMRELPFDCFFINVDLGGGYKGLLVHKNIIDGKEDITIHCRQEDEDGYGMFGEVNFSRIKVGVKHFSFAAYGNNGLYLNEKHFGNKEEYVKNQNKILVWVCNFLDAINHPDVEIIERKNTNDNDNQRIKRGKAPNPISNVTINIKGKLYQYLNEERKEVRNHMSYAFWVRGHYIHFWNKKTWNRLYVLDECQLSKQGYQIDKRGVIAKWKFPYIKCKGRSKPLQKDYILKEKKKTIPLNLTNHDKTITSPQKESKQ